MGRDALIQMSKFEYEFLTDTWEGPRGAAYNQAYEFCKEFGWIDGFHMDGTPSLTNKGMEAVRAYQAGENWKRVDCI